MPNLPVFLKTREKHFAGHYRKFSTRTRAHGQAAHVIISEGKEKARARAGEDGEVESKTDRIWLRWRRTSPPPASPAGAECRRRRAAARYALLASLLVPASKTSRVKSRRGGKTESSAGGGAIETGIAIDGSGD